MGAKLMPLPEVNRRVSTLRFGILRSNTAQVDRIDVTACKSFWLLHAAAAAADAYELATAVGGLFIRTSAQCIRRSGGAEFQQSSAMEARLQQPQAEG